MPRMTPSAGSTSENMHPLCGIDSPKDSRPVPATQAQAKEFLVPGS